MSCRSLTLAVISSLVPFLIKAQDKPASQTGSSNGQDTVTASPRCNLHFQTTYIYQVDPHFHALYSSMNSLNAEGEHQNSLTATLYAGVRLWKGAEAYINPELAGGSGLSGALGMGGSSNGETFRVGNPAPTLYLARAYFVQEFSIGNNKGNCNMQPTDDDANQLGGYQPDNHIRFTIGKSSLGDIFDQNEFSNSPRTQFMNWSLMNTGAWDYAANVRGYTYAFTTEVAWHNFTYKLALASLPTEANGSNLSTDFGKSIGINLGIEHDYKWHGLDGNIRILGYRNRTHMGSYVAATADALATGTTPDVTATRAYGRNKTGFALSADQYLTKDLGAFIRLGYNDGKTETWVFTEIDQTAAIGLSLKGRRWKRPDDVAGLAIVVNGLSRQHHNYLAAGGTGFILGDGAISYSPEAIAEAYYSILMLHKGIWLTGDYQFCLHPGYNKDRGPVNIFSVRLHVEL